MEWHLGKLGNKDDVLGFDCDAEDTPDFYGCYKNYAEVITSRFSDDRDNNTAANDIFNRAVAGKKNIIVNMPATAHQSFQQWLRSNGVVQLAQEHRVQLVIWFVTSGEYDSIKPLEISIKEFLDIPHVIVKNQKYRDWEYFDQLETLKELIEQHQCKQMELPYLYTSYASRILANRLSFGAAYKPDTQIVEPGKEPVEFFILERQNVWEYMKGSYAAFEETGYLPIA
ncbi:MAG TPA: hypothetical protein V6C98_02385 [Thermosynechococcaceae cyanobacterium]